MDLATSVGWIFSAVGVGLFVLAVRQFIRKREFVRNSDVASGVVVALREDCDPEMIHAVRFPTVRFRTPAGRDVTFESDMGIGGRTWAVGDTVAVRYQRDRPEKAELDRIAALWMPVVVLSVLATVFLALGAALLFLDFEL